MRKRKSVANAAYGWGIISFSTTKLIGNEPVFVVSLKKKQQKNKYLVDLTEILVTVCYETIPVPIPVQYFW